MESKTYNLGDLETYICKKKYKGNDLVSSKNIIIEPETIVYRADDVLVLPTSNSGCNIICIWRSQVAKDYFVWNGALDGDERWKLQQEIFSKSPYTDEVHDLLWGKFKHLIREDCTDTTLFNDYFYSQSHLAELRQLIDEISKC